VRAVLLFKPLVASSRAAARVLVLAMASTLAGNLTIPEVSRT